MRNRVFMILFVTLIVEALIMDRALVDEILQAIIAIGIIITAWQSYQVKLRGKDNADKLDTLHEITSSQSDQLDQLTGTAAKVETVLGGHPLVQSEQPKSSTSEGANDGSEGSIH